MFGRKSERTVHRPRRILVAAQANIASTTGGSITIFHHFCQLLAGMGYDVTGTCHSENPARPPLLDPRVHFVNTCYSDGPGGRYRPAFNRLVGRLQPDLIVFFFPHYCLEVRLKRCFNDIPRIIMFHSRPDYLFAQIPGFVRKLRPHYINTHAQVLLESYRDLLPDYIRRGPVHVIANGIQPLPGKTDYGVSHRKMVYFSRVDRLKGVDLLIDAMVRVKEKHPDWSVDIYGDVEPASFAEELQADIDRKGLSGRIRLMGLSSRPKDETLREYDFGVFPSRVEGFSIGLGEMMSAGLACIGLRSCSGVNEVIVNGENGLLCEDTPEALANALCRLIGQPQERERMGLNARLWMRQYDPAIIDMQWIRLVRTVLGEEDFHPTATDQLMALAEGRHKSQVR